MLRKLREDIMISHRGQRRAPHKREMDLRWESLSGRGDAGAMRWLLRADKQLPDTHKEIVPEKMDKEAAE